jgi:hypothetical protein
MKGSLPAVMAGFFVATAAFAAPFAYVPNEKSVTISVIDTATDEVVPFPQARNRAASRHPRTAARCT